MKRIRNVILGANILVIMVTLVAFLSPMVHPEKSVIPGLMSLAFPILIILNGLFVLVWIVLKNYAALLSLTAILLGWNTVTNFLNFNRSANITDDAITVATLNMHHMVDLNESRRPSEAQVLSLVEDLDSPDLLCLQESGPARRYQEALGFEHFHRIEGTSNAIFSNFEILDHGTIDPGPGHTRSGWYDVLLPADTVRMFLLYLASNRITAESEKLMEEGSLQEAESWREAGSLALRYARASKVRAAQAALIREAIDASPHPVLVCGDFNDVPLSYSVATIRRDLSDTFKARGRGTGTTYAGKLPGLRIDYILVDDRFEVLSHRVPRLDVSDHHPVIAKIRITDL